MPDLQNFAVTRSGTATIANAPRWIVSGQICNSRTGAVIRDFTGANAVGFLQIFALLSAADQDDLVARWVMDVLRKQFPADFA